MDWLWVMIGRDVSKILPDFWQEQLGVRRGKMFIFDMSGFFGCAVWLVGS